MLMVVAAGPIGGCERDVVKRSLLRAGLAFVLGLTLVAGSLAPQIPAPFVLDGGETLAADASVSTCDWASFSAAVDAVQASGGGTITFDCAGTITFTGEKVITSDVTIIGNGSVIFDGNGSTRLFTVNSGASLELIGLTLQNGNSIADGGAIYSSGTVTITASTLSGNSAGSDESGGAIDSDGGTLTITASTLSGNSATQGGAIDNDGGTVTITASTLSGNSATQGGAIDNDGGTVTITASTLSGNSASNGGAIDNDGGTINISYTTFSGNAADNDIAVDEGVGRGGAIYSKDNSILNISYSTFSNNIAGPVTGWGGAIFFSSSGTGVGVFTADNSTFYQNRAGGPGGAGWGGALYFSSTSGNSTDATITNSTFSENRSNTFGDSINRPYEGAVTIATTILVDSSETTPPNCSGSSTVSLGYNLSNDASCGLNGIGDVQNSANVNLGPLADNGGPTQTMLPQTGSDAIDTADCALSSATDQRGADRPDAPATTCDKGAVEVGATVPVQIFAAYNASGPIDVGESATIGTVAYGPAGASLDYDFDCDNDGSYETQGTGTGSNGTASCSFADDGSFTVGVQVCDAADNGNCDTGTTTVTVNDLNPTITDVTNDGPIDEGSSATITVTATDPGGVNDPLMYEFDCDNSGGYEVGPQSGNSTLCSFADNGSFTVPVRVTDGDGGSATDSTTVAVNNVDPDDHGCRQRWANERRLIGDDHGDGD